LQIRVPFSVDTKCLRRTWHSAEFHLITSLDYSTPFGAQILHLRRAEAEPAEDFGIALAELGGDGAHPHALAYLDRGADVRDFAKFRVARVLHEAAVASLAGSSRVRGAN
jgi:hypothetical protein